MSPSALAIRLTILPGLAVLIALGLTGCDRPGPPASGLGAQLERLERPDLVLIVVDTLRADWTTPYGSEEDTSPEIARWAERGVLFERVRAQSSWTKMSMASLLTSLWPRSHAITEATDGLGDAALTVAEVLSQAGYATYAVQTNGWLHQSFGFHQGFDRYAFPAGRGAARMPRSTTWPHAGRVLDEARRLLRAHDTTRPYFLYLHFMDVHEYAGPEEFRRFGTDGAGAYRAAIRWVDHTIEQVRSEIDETGQLGRTVMVFSSDHGEAFGEHGKYGHARDVLTAVLSVPLIFRFPFRVEPMRITTQVRNLDIAPTLLELAGVPAPERFEGRSLVPLMTGADREGASDRPTFAALGRPLFRDASRQRSLNDGVWTYARSVEPDPEPRELLYDRSVDPGENVNLIEREPTHAARMRDLLSQHFDQEPLPAVLEDEVEIDPEIARRLRALGYLRGDADPE